MIDITKIKKEYIDKIDSLNDEELVDLWKKTYSKAKGFKKNNSNHEYYMNIANYILKKHQENNIIVEEIKTKGKNNG